MLDRLALIVTLLSCLGLACASPAPEPAGTLPASAEPAALPFPDAARVCDEHTRRLTWDDLGVGDGYVPRDLALAEDAVWVLLQPSALMRVSRYGGKEPVFVSPRGDEEWSAVDVDPLDGKLWVAVRHGYRLLHLTPEGEAKRVRLTRVAGEGGLIDVRAGADALHTQPFCANHALWTVERSGEMVVAAFRAAEALEDLGSQGAVNLGHACPRVHSARGPEGEVVVFDPVTVQLHRAHGTRTWEAFAGPFALQPPGRYTAPEEMRVEILSGDETIPPEEAPRYLPDLVRGLVYLDGEPHLLGDVIQGTAPARPDEMGSSVRDPLGTVLYRVDDDTLVPFFESCGRSPLLRVETDAHGLAALTPDALLLGSTTADQR